MLSVVNHAGSAPLDTPPGVQALQRDVLRGLGGAERVAILFRLSTLVRDMAMAGIASRHPDYADDQVRMAFRRLVLGDDLVRRAWPDTALVDP